MVLVREVWHHKNSNLWNNGIKIIACEYSCSSLHFTANEILSRGMSETQWQKFRTDDLKICLESGQELWLINVVVKLFYILLTNDRKKTTVWNFCRWFTEVLLAKCPWQGRARRNGCICRLGIKWHIHKEQDKKNPGNFQKLISAF